MALVSIGMPVYQRTQYFEEALRSLVTQTYRDIEVFVSDNNSSHDDFREIFTRVVGDDPRFTYKKRADTIDVFDHYVYVFDNAKSKYFMWASDDDVWHKEFVERAVRVLESQKRYSAWFCNIEGINGEGLVHREYDSLKRFQSTSLKLLDMARFLYEPEILGKANLFYSVFLREELAETVRAFSKPSDLTWGFDMVFVYHFLCRHDLYVDRDILFQKREGTVKNYVRVTHPRLMVQHILDPDTYFANYVRVSNWPKFSRFVISRRRAEDARYLALMASSPPPGIVETPIEEARRRSF